MYNWLIVYIYRILILYIWYYSYILWYYDIMYICIYTIIFLVFKILYIDVYDIYIYDM